MPLRLAAVLTRAWLRLLGVAGRLALRTVILFLDLHYAFLSPEEPGAAKVRFVVAIAEIMGAFALRALAPRRVGGVSTG